MDGSPYGWFEMQELGEGQGSMGMDLRCWLGREEPWGDWIAELALPFWSFGFMAKISML